MANILPPARHIIGKAHTVMIECDNGHTRHHLGRMTRRAKVASKKGETVYAAIKLWCALTQPDTFAAFQQSTRSIFR